MSAEREFVPLGIAVLTVSDTRTPETDRSGQLIRELSEAAEHRIVRYQLLPDDPEQIEATLTEFLNDPALDVLITNGSTGISARDTAYEVVTKLLEKRLDGFGELFRSLSYEEIGSSAMLSRAVAGIANCKVIFSMPGSSNAVRLGMTKLILPQIGHLIKELSKHDPPQARA